MKSDLDNLPFPVHMVPGKMDTGNKHAAQNGYRWDQNRDSDLNLNVTSKFDRSVSSCRL